MQLTKVKISNFRCFGKDETTIFLNDLTGFIGHNSSGKTSLMQALLKMFGDKAAERIIHRSDFHVPKDVNPEKIVENNFFIEAVFKFPELGEEGDGGYSIPLFFKNFVIDDAGGKPYLRIRLEANWKRSSSPEGSIESNIFYITASEDDVIKDENRRITTRHDLDNIKMVYVPAIRKPSEQLKNVSGTIISRILNGINWTQGIKDDLKIKIDEVDSVFGSEEGVSLLKDSLRNQWKKYHRDVRYSNAELKFNSTDLDTILKKIEVKFTPTESSREYNVDELGDGLRSLFYISLVNTLLDIEHQILKQITEQDKGEELTFSLIPPVLTIVAVEEPENHISPHLLGRVIDNLKEISKKENAQTILTSHTPSIIKRISPEDIRHFRMSNPDGCSKIKSIALPDSDKEKTYKYVKEAITAYPELYFANLVILGEGDSEEIILPKILEEIARNVDAAGISIVPLGGRHVNHFWKLLYNLDIPFITLLDLDRERYGGGWGRIKYVINQLIANGENKEKLLAIEDGILSDDDFSKMHEWETNDIEQMNLWIEDLENYNVFFSQPLDIDFVMLKAFKNRYTEILSPNEGPFIKNKGKIKDIEILKDKPEEYNERVSKDINATLKDEGGDGSTYSDEERELMIWYNYFFLNRGKPSTHISAMSSISNEELKENLPDCLKKVIESVKEINGVEIEEGADNDTV